MRTDYKTKILITETFIGDKAIEHISNKKYDSAAILINHLSNMSDEEKIAYYNKRFPDD